MTLLTLPTRLLKSLALWLYDHPGKALTLVALLIALSAASLSRIKVDTGVVTLVGHETPSFQTYKAFTDTFGHDFYAIVTVAAQDVLAKDNLERLQALHNDIRRNTPHVQRVISLVNAPWPRRKDERVVISGALTPWPDTGQALQARQQAILDYPPYHNFLINADRSLTLVVVELKKEVSVDGKTVATAAPQYAEVAQALKQIRTRHQSDDFRLLVTGEAVTNVAVERAFLMELLAIGSASYAFGVILMWLLFRRVTSVVLPGLIIAATIIMTFASMAVSDAPLQLTSSIIPPLIVGLGVADAIHLLNAFYRHQQSTLSSREAFTRSLDETLGAILMTSITTAIGLFSFGLVQVYALSGFGLYAGVAALIACIMTILLAAPLLALASARTAARAPLLHIHRDRIGRLASRFVRFSGKHHKGIILFSLAITLVSAYGITRITLNHDTLDWVPQDWEELRGMRLIDEHFASVSAFDLILDSGRRDGVLDPSFMKSLRELAETITSRENTVFSAARSIDSYLQQISLAMDGKVTRYHEHENAQDLAWRDMRFFQLAMPTEFRSLVSSDYRYVRLTASTSRRDAMEFHTARQQLADALAGQQIPAVSVTGLIPILRETLDVIITGAISSFIQSMLAIGVLMCLFFRSLRVGVLSMLPNVAPILLVLATLSALDVQLDMITIMIGSLVIGVIVDDTIHFISNFQRALNNGKTPAEACEYALSTSGHAMLATSVVLIGSFAVMGISQLENIQLFAMISTSILALGLLADVLLMPAIMQWLYRHHDVPASTPPSPDAGAHKKTGE